MKVKFWIDLDRWCYDKDGMKYKSATADPSQLSHPKPQQSTRYTFEVEFPDLEAVDRGAVKAVEESQ
jgi:hypothetical protein